MLPEGPGRAPRAVAVVKANPKPRAPHTRAHPPGRAPRAVIVAETNRLCLTRVWLRGPNVSHD
jgi:hypothetical protein